MTERILDEHDTMCYLTNPKLKNPLGIIFGFLPLNSLLSLRQTCSYFKNFIFSKEDTNYTQFIHRYWNGNTPGSNISFHDTITSMSMEIIKKLEPYSQTVLFVKFPDEFWGLDAVDYRLESLVDMKENEFWFCERYSRVAICSTWNTAKRKFEQKSKVVLETKLWNFEWVKRHGDKLYCLAEDTLEIFSLDGTRFKTIEEVIPEHESSVWVEMDDQLYVVYNTTESLYIEKFSWELDEMEEECIEMNVSVNIEDCGCGVSKVFPVHLPDGTPCLQILQSGTESGFWSATTLSLIDLDGKVLFELCKGPDLHQARFNEDGTRLAELCNSILTVTKRDDKGLNTLWTRPCKFDSAQQLLEPWFVGDLMLMSNAVWDANTGEKLFECKPHNVWSLHRSLGCIVIKMAD